ncbi:MAG: carboxylating nicotinate-nucleotide diphosphorylase [Nitrosopumilus sp.]|nr:carboxylating nicotinate-nucleotide diphosphorylase [Nitrosopumilus sp.]
MSKYSDLYNSDYPLLKNEIEQRSLLTNFLNEDIGTGDITSNILIDDNIEVNAEIICKDDKIVVSGLNEAITIFDICDCDSQLLVNDGSFLEKGTTVMVIQGPAKSILKAERTALNIIMHMSGISTKTSQFVKKLDKFSKYVSISSTRKTSPGLRYFDKKSVVLGGGISHRYRLDQLVLIKDNHIAIVGSVHKAVRLIKSKYGSSRKIECEVSNYQDIIDAIESGSDIVMLDNFTPDLVRTSLKKIKNLGLRNKIVIEVSGGITLDNIYDYASSLPDIISVGSLTHSFKSVDFSLEISST